MIIVIKKKSWIGFVWINRKNKKWKREKNEKKTEPNAIETINAYTTKGQQKQIFYA